MSQRARHARVFGGVKGFLGSLTVSTSRVVSAGFIVGANLATACTAYDRDQYASLLTASSRADGGIGDDERDDDATSPGTDGEAQPGDDAGLDAPGSDGGDDICGASTQQGSWIDVERPGGQAPALTGGVIAAGTYVLTAYRGYANAPIEDGEVRETIEISVTGQKGTFARRIERRSSSGNVGPTGFEQTFSPGTDPETIVTDIVCSDSHATGKDVVYYAATATSFAFVSADVVREYARLF